MSASSPAISPPAPPPRTVLYVDRSPIFAGAEECLVSLAAALDRGRYEPVLCFDRPRPHHPRFDRAGAKVVHRADGLPWWVVSERWPASLGTGRPPRGVSSHERHLWARRLGGVLEETGAAILHVNLLRSRCAADLRTARRLGVKTVGHARNLQSQAPLRPDTLALCDRVICMTDLVREEVAAAADPARTDPAHILRSYDGVAADVATDPAGFRANLGLPADARVVSSVATLEPRKGHDTAIRAFAALADEFPALHLLVVGGTTAELPESAPYAAGLRRLAEELNLTDRVTFTGHVSDVPSAYAASEAVLALSRDGEAFGRVPPEAAAAGSPVVGTHLGATPEVVLHEKTGLLVPPDDPPAAAAALGRLLRDRPFAAGLVAAARERLRTTFHPAAHAREVQAIYDDLLGEPAGSSVPDAPSVRDAAREPHPAGGAR